MRLEEAISKLNHVNEYKEKSYPAFEYWNTRLEVMDNSKEELRKGLQNKLKDTLIHHHNFYGVVDILNEWAKLEPPNVNNYGINAKKWLRAEKITNYGIWTMLGGFGMGITGLIATSTPIISLPFMVAGGIGGIASNYFREKTNQLQLKEDTIKYIGDLAEYYKRDNHFNENTLLFLEKSIERYTDSLKSLINDFKGYDCEREDDLEDNLIEVQIFKKCFRNIIQTIRKNKKYPVPIWSGGIAQEIILAETNLEINYLKIGEENINKSIPDLLSKNNQTKKQETKKIRNCIILSPLKYLPEEQQMN